MPVSGLVLTLDESPLLQASARAALGSDARITLGDAIERRLPVVTETESLTEGEELAEEIARMPGVLFVDVVSIDFSDLTERGR